MQLHTSNDTQVIHNFVSIDPQVSVQCTLNFEYVAHVSMVVKLFITFLQKYLTLIL